MFLHSKGIKFGNLRGGYIEIELMATCNVDEPFLIQCKRKLRHIPIELRQWSDAGSTSVKLLDLFHLYLSVFLRYEKW